MARNFSVILQILIASVSSITTIRTKARKLIIYYELQLHGYMDFKRE